jgi:hypothetical protein
MIAMTERKRVPSEEILSVLLELKELAELEKQRKREEKKGI